MRARLAAAVVLVCGLTACSAGEETVQEVPDAGPAPQALASAVAVWTDDNTGRFTFFLGEQNDFLLASKGDYVMDQDLVRMGSVAQKNGEVITTELVLGRDESWSRSAVAPASPEGCWVRRTGERAGELTGGAFGDTEPSAAFLAQLAVVDLAEGTSWEAPGTVLHATTDLYTLVSTLGQSWRQLDLEPTSRHRSEVTFLLDQGEIVAWRTDLGTILESVREAGVELTTEMEQVIDLDVALPVTTSFADLGADVEIDPPATKNTVDFSSDRRSLERAQRDCSG